MNKNRTYAVEIECHSRLDRAVTRRKIEEAFRAAGLNDFHCITDMYMHDTDQSNFTHWKVKPDSSITQRANSSITSTHPVGTEVVSPILKGDDGLKAIEAVCSVLDTDDYRISKTCGLHAHHGVNQHSEKTFNFVNSWINTEQYVMKVLPPSRQRNYYCRTWKDKCQDDFLFGEGEVPRCRPNQSATSWWDNHVDDRYANVNLGSIQMRNTIEFRLHSGTVEFPKIKNWLIWTQAFVDVSLKREIDADSLESLVDRIEKLSGSTIEEVNHESVSLFVPGAKKQKLPKQGTKLRMIADMLIEGKRKDQIVRSLNDKFGHNTKSHRTQVTCKIADFQSTKYGFGWKIVKKSDGKYKVETGSATEPEITTTTGDCPEDIKQACRWMIDRYELFS